MCNRQILTIRNINVNAVKSKMADVWHPAMSINIKKLKPRIFLFKFFHKEDINWFLKEGSLWSFDNAMMVMTEVSIGREPLMFHCGMLICGCKFLSFHLILCQRLLESNWVFFLENFLNMTIRIKYQYMERIYSYQSQIGCQKIS